MRRPRARHGRAPRRHAGRAPPLHRCLRSGRSCPAARAVRDAPGAVRSRRHRSRSACGRCRCRQPRPAPSRAHRSPAVRAGVPAAAGPRCRRPRRATRASRRHRRELRPPRPAPARGSRRRRGCRRAGARDRVRRAAPQGPRRAAAVRRCRRIRGCDAISPEAWHRGSRPALAHQARGGSHRS